jgi:hypothetical protein
MMVVMEIFPDEPEDDPCDSTVVEEAVGPPPITPPVTVLVEAPSPVAVACTVAGPDAAPLVYPFSALGVSTLGSPTVDIVSIQPVKKSCTGCCRSVRQYQSIVACQLLSGQFEYRLQSIALPSMSVEQNFGGYETVLRTWFLEGVGREREDVLRYSSDLGAREL